MNGIEVGKEVVCINQPKDVDYILGKIYPCLSLKVSKCKCRDVMIDIGKTCPINYVIYCDVCDEEYPYKDGIGWRDANDFAPLADISELEELLKEQPKEIQQ